MAGPAGPANTMISPVSKSETELKCVRYCGSVGACVGAGAAAAGGGEAGDAAGWATGGWGCTAGCCGVGWVSAGCLLELLIASLNSRIPLPSERPISGSRRAPNTNNRITTMNAMCRGLSSPIAPSLERFAVVSSPPARLARRLAHQLHRHHQREEREADLQGLPRERVRERHAACRARDREESEQ